MAHSMTESPFFVFVVFTVFVFGINTSPIFLNPVFYAFGVFDVFEVLLERITSNLMCFT